MSQLNGPIDQPDALSGAQGCVIVQIEYYVRACLEYEPDKAVTLEDMLMAIATHDSCCDFMQGAGFEDCFALSTQLPKSSNLSAVSIPGTSIATGSIGQTLSHGR